jgi:hypothetical protein
VSEQNLLDCSSSQGDGDCTSRQVGTDFQDVKDNRGQDTEESQPYEGKVNGAPYCGVVPALVEERETTSEIKVAFFRIPL